MLLYTVIGLLVVGLLLVFAPLLGEPAEGQATWERLQASELPESVVKTNAAPLSKAAQTESVDEAKHGSDDDTAAPATEEAFVS